MKVELIQGSYKPVKLITDVASICYGKDEAKYPDKLLKHLFNNGHHSVFEHVYYTFKIEGISRACLAQLTRHRHASYSVRSQRYCNESEVNYVTPDDILNNKGLDEYYDIIMKNLYTSYNYLIEQGVKKEDARFILPNATTTDLYMSMNLRELMHIYKLRTSKSAQWEIKELLNKMVDEVMVFSPELQLLFEEEKE